jgi:hypothetical protein
LLIKCGKDYYFWERIIIKGVIKKGEIIAFLVIIAWTNSFAQQLSHQVLVPAAGVASGKGYNYSQTIGETAVETIVNGDFTLTQGFQQPRITFNLGIPPPGTGVNIGPNPATHDLFVYLWGEESRSFRISIISINGIVIYSEELILYDNYYNVETISVANLVTGFYIVRVESKDGVINRVFKLEKM